MTKIIKKDMLNTVATKAKDSGLSALKAFELPASMKEAFPKHVEFANKIETEHTEFLGKTMDAATRRATENKAYYDDRVEELEREIREDNLSPEEKLEVREEIHRYESLKEKEDAQELEVQKAVIEEHKQYSGTLWTILIMLCGGAGYLIYNRK